MRPRGYPFALLLTLMACGGAARPNPDSKDSATPALGTVVFLGTSITAGYGLDPRDAYPSLIQARIDSAHLPFQVLNAGVSGETSAGARRRIDWLLSQGPLAVVVVETGANDGLRGQSVDSLHGNLDAILAAIDTMKPRPRVIVAGMEALPNMGRSYRDRFREVFPAAAKAHDAIFLPFLLDGVAGIDSLNQPDGVHPNIAGARIVAENVWRVLGPVLSASAQGATP